jgi:hypothetical protein
MGRCSVFGRLAPDAATYITKLRKTEASLPEWQVATEALLVVVENNGPPMFARIGFMRALTHGKPDLPARKRQKML